MERLHGDPQHLERKSPNTTAPHLLKKKVPRGKKTRSVFDPVSNVDNSYSFGIIEIFGIARLFAHHFHSVNYECLHV